MNGKPQIALRDQVNATPVVLLGIWRDRPLRRLIEQISQFLVDRHHDARTTAVRIQPAGHRKHRVANLFGVETPA